MTVLITQSLCLFFDVLEDVEVVVGFVDVSGTLEAVDVVAGVWVWPESAGEVVVGVGPESAEKVAGGVDLESAGEAVGSVDAESTVEAVGVVGSGSAGGVVGLADVPASSL